MASTDLNAIIVNPDSGGRVRLRNAMMTIPEFKKVKAIDSLDGLWRVFRESDFKYDVIFIAERFGKVAIQEFFEDISEYEKAKRIQEANRNSNESKANQQADEFIKIKASIEPADTEAVMLERQKIHKSVLYSTRDRYAKTIQNFDYSVFSKAEDVTADMLDENWNKPMCSHDALTKAKDEAHALQGQNELSKDSMEKKRNETNLS